MKEQLIRRRFGNTFGFMEGKVKMGKTGTG